MMPYLLHAAALVAISYVFYRLLLGKETFFHLNRWVLLACMVGAFALPLIEVPQAWSLQDEIPFFRQPAPAQPLVQDLNPAVPEIAGQPGNEAVPFQGLNPAANASTGEEAAITPALPSSWRPERIAAYVYWCGVLVFGLNFLIQLFVLLFQMYTLPSVKDGPVRIVEWNRDKAPCSFGNCIFINPEQYDWETYNQIIRHEKIHIAQGHSFDILLAELLVVVQWFNPFAWQYRRSVEQNIEYLTDAEMLRSRDVDTTGYQMNLLKVAVPNLPLGLTTNYNHSTLKKRILMMQSKKSSVRSGWKYLFLLPLFAFSALIFNAVQSQNTLDSNEQRNYNSLFNFNDSGFDPSGLWQGTIEGNEVCMVFNKNLSKEKKHGSWSSSSCFKKEEFDALPTGKEGEFHLAREAGKMTLTGKFDNNEGYGRFTFAGDPGFKAYLEQNGLDAPDEEEMVHLFFANITKDYVAYLKQKKFPDFSMDQLMASAIHGLDKKSIEAYEQEFAANPKERTLESMVTMQIHDLSPKYMQSIRAMGFKNATMEDLLSAKIHDVTSEYIREIQAAGYKNLDLENILSFKIHGVDAKFIQAAVQTNGKELSADDVLSVKIHNVNPEDMAKFKELGLGEVSMEDLTAFSIHGIDAAYIKSWKDAGYPDLDKDELLSVKIHGVTPEFIQGFNKNNNTNISIDDALSIKIHDVSAEFIQGFEAMGYKNIGLDEAVGLKIHDVSPQFIKAFESLGYKQIDLDEAMGLKIHNVTAEFIKSYEPLGFKQIDLDEVMSLKIHEVTPEFIRSMREKGFKDLSLDEYVSLKIMGSANRRTRGRED
ncbi:MAG: M56 family metallopeptidase [Saprospiraceae bacterium]